MGFLIRLRRYCNYNIYIRVSHYPVQLKGSFRGSVQIMSLSGSVFFQFFPMWSDSATAGGSQTKKVQRPASFFDSCSEHFGLKHFSAFQKAAIFPGPGDNIHCIFVSYRSCLGLTSSLLWCPNVKYKKKQMVNCKVKYVDHTAIVFKILSS